MTGGDNGRRPFWMPRPPRPWALRRRQDGDRHRGLMRTWLGSIMETLHPRRLSADAFAAALSGPDTPESLGLSDAERDGQRRHLIRLRATAALFTALAGAMAALALAAGGALVALGALDGFITSLSLLALAVRAD